MMTRVCPINIGVFQTTDRLEKTLLSPKASHRKEVEVIKQL